MKTVKHKPLQFKKFVELRVLEEIKRDKRGQIVSKSFKEYNVKIRDFIPFNARV